MKASQVPWWGWVLIVFGVLVVLDGDLGLIPLIILVVIGWKMFGRQLSGRGGPRNRVPPGGQGRGTVPPADGPPSGSSVPGSEPGWAERPGGPPPMPTIDVPRYPGSSAAPGPSAGTDPARSLLRLQLAQAGRDLEQALAAGDAARGHQILEGMDRLLTAGGGRGGPERELHDDVRTALTSLDGGAVDRPALDRVVTRSRSMGQTGHHE